MKLEFPGHGKWFIEEQGLDICLTVGKCEKCIIKLEICETYENRCTMQAESQTSMYNVKVM